MFPPVRSVVSVQSHVAYGHVGNAAAVFPLQRMGFEVWPVHTCQLSSRLGYPDVRGDIFRPAHVRDVLSGLEGNGILGQCSAMVSGFLGRAALGKVIAKAVGRMRDSNLESLYVCDPVMGDDNASGTGVLYAPADIPAFFADCLVPMADVVVPNRFELALLAGMDVRTVEDALKAAKAVIGRGPRLVVTTSLPLPDPGEIGCLAVTAEQAWLVRAERIPIKASMHGTGDIFTALLTGALLHDVPIPQATAHAASSLHAIIKETIRREEVEPQLIVCQEYLLTPPYLFDAESLVLG
ncbi:pyridoxal kinase [Haematospirillum jordaniae]|uniref:pyridoxal kinase n=1 Tax=Haematospirillum jordaniae TaxID=1549855 RepID=UPI001432B069|nr:pyridoxal kinase [Haematospirillum jordaniae]NKD45199.1 pyridoxal kinase [Haematospirillum jordaniae]NKD91114.1 pyridoxal kinase [Haematospirillum jordaniae]